MILSKREARIVTFAAKEAGRYTMHAVCLRTYEITPDDTGRSTAHGVRANPLPEFRSELVCTDGRRLAVLPVELEATDEDAIESFGGSRYGETLLPPEPFRAAMKGKVGAQWLVRLNYADGRLSVTVQPAHRNATPDNPAPDPGSPVQSFPCDIDGEFPRYSAVIPEPNSARWGFGCNAKYLADAQALLTDDVEAVSIAVKSPLSPVRVTAPNSEAVAVIMPCTLDGPARDATDRQDEAERLAREWLTSSNPGRERLAAELVSCLTGESMADIRDPKVYGNPEPAPDSATVPG